MSFGGLFFRSYNFLLISRVSLLGAGGGKGTLKPPVITLETGGGGLGGLRIMNWIDITHMATMFA